MKLKNYINAALVLAAAFSMGCTTTISNLTPGQHTRNVNNIYPFEVSFDTKQKVVRENTLKPFVMIGAELYPMQPAPVVKGRWEAQVPIAATNNVVYYRYKFDYEYDAMAKPGAESSRLSPTYQLEIVDK